jgi:uncharacterized cupredoxin-like copper-binding protein
MKRFAALCFAAITAASPIAHAEGFLVGKTLKLPDLVLGEGEAGYGFSPKEPNKLETGKGYRWVIKSTGKKECAFEASEFFQNVWFRKAEVGKVEIKFATLNEIEFEEEGAVELFFTPIKPGEYKWECKGLGDKGLKGTISVK